MNNILALTGTNVDPTTIVDGFLNRAEQVTLTSKGLRKYVFDGDKHPTAGASYNPLASIGTDESPIHAAFTSRGVERSIALIARDPALLRGRTFGKYAKQLIDAGLRRSLVTTGTMELKWSAADDQGNELDVAEVMGLAMMIDATQAEDGETIIGLGTTADGSVAVSQCNADSDPHVIILDGMTTPLGMVIDGDKLVVTGTDGDKNVTYQTKLNSNGCFDGIARSVINGVEVGPVYRYGGAGRVIMQGWTSGQFHALNTTTLESALLTADQPENTRFTGIVHGNVGTFVSVDGMHHYVDITS